MKTSTKATISLFDTTANKDGYYVSNDVYSFTDINILNNNDYRTVRYATLEPNTTLLDGSFSFVDNDTTSSDFAYWSASIGDADGDFATNPVITRNFSIPHSSVGISLYFDERYALPIELTVTVYGEAGSVLTTQTVRPTSYYHFIDYPVENYRGIRIEFNKVNPYSRGRLKYIGYGRELIYSSKSDKNLSKASVLEQIDITSSELAVNTSSLTVIDTDRLFSIINPQGIYKFLQRQQRINIYESINDEEYLIACHYLKEWSTVHDTISTFKCQDIIGVMDNATFAQKLYTNVTAGAIIDEIMDSFGWDDYFVEDSIRNIVLTGCIKESSVREALQQVAFACGAVVDTSRSTGINIYKASVDTQTVITRGRKLTSVEHEIKQEEMTTDVVVYNHDYYLDGDTIKDNDGKTYSISSSGEYAEYPNVIEVKDATLSSVNNSQQIADYLLEFSRYRLKHRLKIVCSNEKAGNMSAVQTSDTYIPLLITSMELDLTGGFTANIEGVGNALKIPDSQYARAENYELYAMDGGLI